MSQLDIIIRSLKQGTGAAEATKDLKDLENQSKNTGSMLSNAGKIAAGVFAAGLAAAAAFAVKAVGDTQEYNLEIRKLSSNLSLTTEETSKLVQVADDYGVTQDGLTRSLQLAVKNGFEPNIENLAKLADETNAMASPTERAAALSKVLGKNWADLAPLFAAGGDEIRKAAGAVSDNLVVTQEAADASRALQVAQDDLGDTVQGFAYELGNTVIPVLTKFFKILGDGLDLITRVNKEEAGYAVMLDLSAEASKRLAAAQYLVNSGVEGYEYVASSLIPTLTQAAEAEKKFYDRGHVITAMLADTGVAAYGAKFGFKDLNNTIHEVPFSYYAEGVDGAVLALRRWQAAQDEVANDEALKKAMDDLNQSQINVKTSFYGLATSLTGTTTYADVTKAALGELEKKARENGLSADQLSYAWRAAGLAAGLVDEKSLAMTRGIAMANDAFATGQASPEEYANALKLMPKAAADGVVTLKEIGLGALETVRKSKQDLMDETGNAAGDTVDKTSTAISTSMLKVSNAVSASKGLVNSSFGEMTATVLGFEAIAGREINKTINVTYYLTTVGEPPTPGRAGGGPVYKGDAVNVNEIFGEKFTPYQAGTMQPVNNYLTTNNIRPGAVVINPPPGMSVKAIANEVMSLLGRETKQAVTSGQGWVGG